jgi:hypothetical protein
VFWWIAAGGAGLVAVLAGIGDWRRRSRHDLDRIGLLDWPSIQMFALMAAVVCAIMAAHR